MDRYAIYSHPYSHPHIHQSGHLMLSTEDRKNIEGIRTVLFLDLCFADPLMAVTSSSIKGIIAVE